jgi:hypothetical protein
LGVGTSSPLLWIDRNTGRLGVGTSSPGLAFSVAGDILGSGILNLSGTTGTSTVSGGLSVNTLNVNSTTATSTFGNGIQMLGGCYRTPSGNCLKEVVTIIKTSDETVTNNTLQDDNELFLAMAANETWYFTLSIGHIGNATADFKYSITVPTGATLRWGCTGALVDQAGVLTECQSITTSGSLGARISGATTDRHFMAFGVVVNGSTAGNLQFQWAQDTTTAVDTKVLTNSYLEAHK